MRPFHALVFVEGLSDVEAMTTLLAPLIERKAQEGVTIAFYEAPPGDKKRQLLLTVPRNAVDMLANRPDTCVIVVPDLYPLGRGFPHQTAAELCAGIRQQFLDALREKRRVNDARIAERFHAFCFKHDMEALLLAAEDSLKARLRVAKFGLKWKKPVEDQNGERPPSRIVEELFRKHRRTYHKSTDALFILQKVDYRDIAAACPQCFAPFVAFLEAL